MYKLLEIEIYGPFGSLYELQIDFFNKIAKYKRQEAMFVDPEIFNINLDDSKLNNFMGKLDQYKLLDWKEEYSHPSMKKGYKWEMRIVYGEISKQSSGLVEVPENWDNLCKQVTILLGTKFG
ncbi:MULTISPECIES: hypothetical protein [unclassified Gemella]|uniref:hypothetical protein n=1 Tax=unclassified Gemella TaxID=2624949 RepID=UPI001072FB26|nr:MULTISPECIES: hypothetical protein [unclassified Gemella]MBF0746944.1 hypothetical protein [Gemella sp. 19428wG2_WT2a]MBF0849241.1 hypothetical protein [Streptococcus danieliae]TFU59169.1 hypothetical protein E4T67_04675 [Gemella sp. WT2a]MBF0709637.1 hypothetical protein [Gemella sp. GL1.1]NYS26981.1 hypothetical protein [Gemella sp. GL1]